jgi:hypothetical protein
MLIPPHSLAKVLIRTLVPDIGETLASQLEDAEGATRVLVKLVKKHGQPKAEEVLGREIAASLGPGVNAAIAKARRPSLTEDELTAAATIAGDVIAGSVRWDHGGTARQVLVKALAYPECQRPE